MILAASSLLSEPEVTSASIWVSMAERIEVALDRDADEVDDADDALEADEPLAMASISSLTFLTLSVDRPLEDKAWLKGS